MKRRTKLELSSLVEFVYNGGELEDLIKLGRGHGWSEEELELAFDTATEALRQANKELDRKIKLARSALKRAQKRERKIDKQTIKALKNLNRTYQRETEAYKSIAETERAIRALPELTFDIELKHLQKKYNYNGAKAYAELQTLAKKYGRDVRVVFSLFVGSPGFGKKAK